MSGVIIAEPRLDGNLALSSEQHLLVHSNWDLYQRFLSARDDFHLGLRINYDRGRLELITSPRSMSVSRS